MTLKNYYYVIAVLLYSICVDIHAQVGIGTTSPDVSSILEIESTTQGLLTPRMTSVQRVAIVSPAQGLLVFDTDEDAFYFFDGTNWVKLISENSINDYTGWADYTDGTYTSASPFSLTAGNKVTLPNNAVTIRDTQKPIDVTSFYDIMTSTITGRNGDGINVMIEFKIKPIVNQTTKITVAIDIGGSIGELYKRDFITSKGLNVEHYYVSSFNAYTLDTWEANGGTVKIVSDYAAEIYDIRYVITRTHKAR
ncbi:hypothetical protein KFZ70_15375 [Tamlana fucoidanivorans]|uniref:Uncharacterized protein n=1 Tax=Allotamlana fucoidanivorans TaxID=2583814 RepID=A0A5C4SEY4_9FLAO|nr:hypothetical protein [Tamlana fucoidanivorans]TNJ42166.1 hypothetical protein FGF67_14805 [Tamlana fucoidanivorans]